MTTLKEFETALRERGMTMALAILEKPKERDRANRTIRAGRRIAGKKMTPDVARQIIELHQTTEMTQQEIAFQLGVNQGRVNEVLKHGKWLHDNLNSEEAVARDRAKARMKMAKADSPSGGERTIVPRSRKAAPKPKRRSHGQLSLEDYLNAATPQSSNG